MKEVVYSLQTSLLRYQFSTGDELENHREYHLLQEIELHKIKLIQSNSTDTPTKVSTMTPTLCQALYLVLHFFEIINLN